MFTFAQTRHGYANLWDQAIIKPEHHANAVAVAQRIAQHHAELQAVEDATDVPWWWIGCALYRESDLDFNTYLGNGQTLKKPTTEVPAKRGPFDSFLAGAIDALTLEGLMHLPPEQWTLEFALYTWERFNGQGYMSKGPSPYIWSWTSLYQAGKFTSDGHYVSSVVDEQGGCAAILKAMEALHMLSFIRERFSMVAGPPQPQEPTMPTQPPAPASPFQQPAPVAPVSPVAPRAPGAFGVPGLPIIDFKQIEQFVNTAQYVLPMIAPFFPPARAMLAALPLLDAVLEMSDAAEHVTDPSQIVGVLSEHLASIAADLRAIKPA